MNETSADPATPPNSGSEPEEKIPFMQQLLDNPLLLLFLGVASPSILYILWGVMEVIAIPLAP